MSKRFIVINIFFIMLVLNACSRTQEGENYFPKGSTGSQWEYSVRYSAQDGVQMGSMLIRNVGYESINGRKYYKQINLMQGLPGAGTRVSYIRRAKEGIYKIDASSGTKQEYLTTPFPLRAGDAWTAKSPQGVTHFKAEKIEDLSLNDKKYTDCLKVSFRVMKGSQSVVGITYLAPDIGEVYSALDMGEVKVDYALLKNKL